MGHRGGGGHQAHTRLHASKSREQREKKQSAKKGRGGMSRAQFEKLKRGKKKP